MREAYDTGRDRLVGAGGAPADDHRCELLFIRRNKWPVAPVIRSRGSDRPRGPDRGARRHPCRGGRLATRIASSGCAGSMWCAPRAASWRPITRHPTTSESTRTGSVRRRPTTTFGPVPQQLLRFERRLAVRSPVRRRPPDSAPGRNRGAADRSRGSALGEHARQRRRARHLRRPHATSGWPGLWPTRGAVEAALARLRRRLSGLGMSIRTVRCRGVVLVLSGPYVG